MRWLEALLQAVALGNVEPEVLSSVAVRLSRLDAQLTDTERLQMARQAWLRADRALKDMQRLHRYAKNTPAMKDDLARASGIYRHNTELHEKIMRGLL